MLELYKDGQPIFYNMVNNAIKNNKLSHAYIFDSNGNPDVMDIVLSFVKEIICMDITDDNNIKIYVNVLMMVIMLMLRLLNLMVCG